MKKFWNLFLAAIFVCGSAALLTSCGSDDDGGSGGGVIPTPSGASFQKVQVTYTVTASEALLTDFRINAYYVDSKNSSAYPETMESGTWKKTVEVEASKMPTTFELYYALNPKNKEQGATATTTGEALINYSMTVTTLNSDGTSINSRQIQKKFTADALTTTTVLAEFAKEANKAEHLKFTVGKDGKIQ